MAFNNLLVSGAQ